MRRTLVLAVTAIAVLGACGSDSAKSTTTTTQPGTATDRRIANAALVTDRDLDGFGPVDPGPSEAADLNDLGKDFAQCSFALQAAPRALLKGRSRGYQRGDTVVNSSVTVYKTTAGAAADLEFYRDPAMIGCLEQVYRKSVTSGLPTGSTIQSLSVSPIAPTTGGEATFGFRVTATATSGTGPQTVITDAVGAQVGRAVFSLNILGSAADSAEVQTKVFAHVVDRIRAAEA